MKILLSTIVLLCLTLPLFGHPVYQVPQYSVLVPQPPVVVPVRLVPYWSVRRGLFGRYIMRLRYHAVPIGQQ